MANENRPEKTYNITIVLPHDLRAIGWAVWYTLLGFCLGVAVEHLWVLLQRPW